MWQSVNGRIHTFVPTSDTGLKLNLLQNIIYIPLDVFENNLTKKVHDNAALTEKEAWLTFLSSDDPKVIYMILEQYPGIFRPLYEKICDMCRNTAEVMSMYSKELAILDKNTVMLMMEEQQATIEKQQDTIHEQKETIHEQKDTIHEQKDTINKQQVIIDKLQDTVDKQQIDLHQQQKTNDELLKNVEELKKAVKALQDASKNAKA